MALEPIKNLTEVKILPDSKESLLPRVSTIFTPTLITFDVARPINQSQRERLGISPNGWIPVGYDDLPEFQAKYTDVFGADLAQEIKDDSLSIRLGGTSFVTGINLAGMNSQIRQLNCSAPVGRTNGADNPLFSAVNNRFVELAAQYPGVNLVPSFHDGHLSAVCMCFYEGSDRSMVLLTGCKSEGIKTSAEVGRSSEPGLIVIDTYELAADYSSYAEAALSAIEQQGDTFVMINLGAPVVVPKGWCHIERLVGAAAEAAISGNIEEVNALMQVTGVTSPQELVLAKNLKFLMRTKGQDGAEICYNHNGEIICADYKIPENEIFHGDCTNAGDIFLASVLDGLISLREPISQESLTNVLAQGSLSTLQKLSSRS